VASSTGLALLKGLFFLSLLPFLFLCSALLVKTDSTWFSIQFFCQCMLSVPRAPQASCHVSAASAVPFTSLFQAFFGQFRFNVPKTWSKKRPLPGAEVGTGRSRPRGFFLPFFPPLINDEFHLPFLTISDPLSKSPVVVILLPNGLFFLDSCAQIPSA